MYVAFRRTDAAISVAEHVRDSRMLTLGAFHPHTIQTLETLGLAYTAGKQPEKALAALQQAATGLEKSEYVHVRAGRINGKPHRLPWEQAGEFDQGHGITGVQKWPGAPLKTRQVSRTHSALCRKRCILKARICSRQPPCPGGANLARVLEHPPERAAAYVEGVSRAIAPGRSFARAEAICRGSASRDRGLRRPELPPG